MKVKSLFIVSICLLAILFIVWNGSGKATLVKSQAGTKKVEDFVLHIRVEEVEGQVAVFRSLQYIGEESIEIEHQTPLISVSLNPKNHDFTGSTVKKVMRSGDSYYPQKAKRMKISEEGEYVLYCLAKFQVNGEKKKIKHTEVLRMQ